MIRMRNTTDHTKTVNNRLKNSIKKKNREKSSTDRKGQPRKIMKSNTNLNRCTGRNKTRQKKRPRTSRLNPNAIEIENPKTKRRHTSRRRPPKTELQANRSLRMTRRSKTTSSASERSSRSTSISSPSSTRRLEPIKLSTPSTLSSRSENGASAVKSQEFM